jgi:hypothetical protein
MSPEELRRLIPGTLYQVQIKNGRSTKRVFMGIEDRHPFQIPSGIFTSRVITPLTVTIVSSTQFRFQGTRPPKSELSIPHYDLIACTEVTK